MAFTEADASPSLLRRRSYWGGTRDKPKNVCVGGWPDFWGTRMTNAGRCEELGRFYSQPEPRRPKPSEDCPELNEGSDLKLR